MRSDKLKTLFFLAALSSFLCVFNLCYADTLDTKLSRDKIAMGETLTVLYTLNDNTDVNPDFSALEKDFQILSSNYGNSFKMLNGAISSQKFWQLTLEPKKPGEIIIPEINFGNVKSVARKLVIEEAGKPVVSDKQDSPAFVEASISSAAPYIQSQIIYTYKLFYQAQLENPRIEFPQIKDATFVQLDDGIQYQTTIKGKTFSVIEKNIAIFPQKAGEISIPATHFSAVAYDVNPGRMDNPFYIAAPKSLSLATQAFSLNVRKIPASFQGSTWLPAKNISLTEKWSVDPDKWEAGNPVTRTVMVEAQGLRADQIPDLSVDKVSGVNIYADPAKRSNRVENNSMTGVLEQKVTYIPNTSQSFAIPALKLNWWNLQTDSNALAQLNSVPVRVKGKINNTVTLPTDVPLVSAVKEPEIKTKANPFYFSIWFWIASFFFAVWLITLCLVWKKRSVKNIKVESSPQPNKPPVDTSIELSDESFARACEQGDTALAQQFLLSWAKKQWQHSPLSLNQLRESISDEDFKTALENLEQAIYAKKEVSWGGRDLLSAYQNAKKLKKYHKNKTAKDLQADLLPPLNP
jgi:hypothetical protein